MRIEDRLNVAQFGWAGGWRNMAFIAGRLHRRRDNPRFFLIQQTPMLAQAIPFTSEPPLSDQFPDGAYVSVFARIRGRTILKDDHPVDSVVVPHHLHTRYANGREMDPDEAHRKLMAFISRAPKEAKVDTTLRGMTVETPPELQGQIATPLPATPPGEALRDDLSGDDDPYALNKRDNRIIRNGNHVLISGVIGYMEFRDGGDDPSQNRAQVFVQQSGLLSEAIPVRVYGKQALHVAEVFTPGHMVYVSGELHVDVKKDPATGQLRTTPYVKTFSVEPAQQNHVRFRAGGLSYPSWARELYEKCNGRNDAARAEAGRRMRLVKVKPRAEREAAAAQAAAVPTVNPDGGLPGLMTDGASDASSQG